MATRGIHVVTTTYGTWLPGDERGHCSPLFDLYGRLIRDGHRLNMPDKTSRRVALNRMTGSPKTLSTSEQEVVAGVIRRFTAAAGPCDPDSLWAEAGWPDPLLVRALCVEPDHMHLLISPTRIDISEVEGRIKSRTSAAVCAMSEHADRRRTWTFGGWRVFLFDDHAVCKVQSYIEAHNVRRGSPARRFDFVRRL